MIVPREGVLETLRTWPGVVGGKRPRKAGRRTTAHSRRVLSDSYLVGARMQRKHRALRVHALRDPTATRDLHGPIEDLALVRLHVA